MSAAFHRSVVASASTVRRLARSVISSVVWSVAAALAFVALAGGVAAAHSGIQSYVYVSVFDDALDGRVEYPINDLGPVLGIDFPDDADARKALAIDRAAEIIAYTDQHLELASVGPDGGAGAVWELRFDPDFELLATAAGDYLQVPFVVVRIFDEAPRDFVVTYSGVFEAMPERDALFLVENDWGSATFGNEGEHLLGFSVGAEQQRVDIQAVSVVESVWEVVRRGTVTLDRSMLVLASLTTILVGAVLGRRRDGTPTTWSEGVKRALTRVSLFAAATVVACALTIALAPAISERVALGVGACGVLLAAASVVVAPRRAHAAVLAAGGASGVVVAFGFLFQQLDRSRPVVSFAAFSVGLVATAAVVAGLLLPLLLLIRRLASAPVIAEAVAALAALAGGVWAIERLVDTKFPLRTAELTVADTLTSPIVIAVVTALTAAVLLRSDISPTSAPTSTAAAHDERIET